MTVRVLYTAWNAKCRFGILVFWLSGLLCKQSIESSQRESFKEYLFSFFLKFKLTLLPSFFRFKLELDLDIDLNLLEV